MALPLACRVGEDADAMQIAQAMDTIWQEVDAALAPILGHQGVAALYKRSLHLAGEAHPWITAGQGDAGADMNLPALKSTLSSRSSADAATAGGALLDAFHGLLASLVGPSLTERLLRSVWAHTSSGTPAQDS